MTRKQPPLFQEKPAKPLNNIISELQELSDLLKDNQSQGDTGNLSQQKTPLRQNTPKK